MGSFTVCLLVILVTFLRSSKSSDLKDLAEFTANDRRSSSFSCGKPQPRSFTFEELADANDVQDVHSFIFPPMTVLHRCDSYSGCCRSSKKICAPIVTENVTLVFRVFNQIHRRQAYGKSSEGFIHVTTTNHTECKCQMAHDLPK